MPLGPFDGRVAAFHPKHPSYYIATPNQDKILMPPGHCNVYARLDGRYGPDDHTQWPQPFSRTAPYLCCIPLDKGPAAEASIMWWNPTYDDFLPLKHDGWKTGIGFLPHDELESMEQCCARLRVQVDEYRAKVEDSHHHPVIAPLSANLHRTLSRLRAVAMSRREVLFECRQVQRQWMELRALMDYVEIYEPRMAGRLPPTQEIASVIGCFIQEVDIAEKLFSAGIPYYFIRPVSTISVKNILSIAHITQPDELLELNDYYQPFPCIYSGDSNYNRFRAISDHGLKSLRYTDLFADGNPRGINPHDFEGRESRNPRNNRARPQPCELTFLNLLHVLTRILRSSAVWAARTVISRSG